MKNIHLLLIYICTILFCTSCNENNEFIREQPGEKYSRSEAIANILGKTETPSLYISPELENTPLTKDDVERIKGLASRSKDNALGNMNQTIETSLSRQATKGSMVGYHEELIRIDNDLYMIVALEWNATYGVGSNGRAERIHFADIHISLKDAPSGYWYKIALKGWNFDYPNLIYRGEGELCKYIDNEEHLELIGFTFSIEPRQSGNNQNFRYTLEKL